VTRKYSDLVDYEELDPVKRRALKTFESTFRNPERIGVKVAAIGETAAVLDFLEYDFMLAFNVEGLGTKNLIADRLWNDLKEKREIEEEFQGGKYYRFLGQDAVAMSVTDLVAVGADPIAYTDVIASGTSEWFSDQKRVEELLDGYALAANLAGCAIPQGETPTLPNIIAKETLDLTGSSVGIIKPKSRFTYGQKIADGDCIYGLPSGGICANGVSKARSIIEKLPEGYFTKLPNGTIVGEELLKPTPIYVRPIMEMFEAEVNLHYISPITGHGWNKIARARFPFSYVIEKIPDPPAIFSTLIKFGRQFGFDVTDVENYQVWNMGIFIVLIASKEDEETIINVAGKHGITVFKLGYVQKGDRSVIIKPKNIVYKQ
jgi:phosphoribosylformylglycinamidine cyclo-ligase